MAKLPLLNVFETAHTLSVSLQAYNRTPLEASLRYEILELYRAPIRHLSVELQKQYVGLPLPLPERHRSIAEQHRAMYIELAYGYKHVVLAQADTARPSTLKEATPLARPIQRALRHLTEILLTSHLAYSPPPSGIWREIHTLYRHAESLSLIGVAVDEPLNGARGKNTVCETYKHALLLDLCDPYHLPSRMIAKIDQYLEVTAGLAVLQAATNKPQPNCQYLVDIDNDQAGLVHSEEDVLTPPERYRLLNTLELARTIHSQLTQLQNGESPNVTELPPDFFERGGQEMLRRLINVWGVNPKRVFRRNDATNSKVHVAIGLAAIDYWLNGERRSTPSGDSIGPNPPTDRVSAGTFGAQQARTSENAYNVTTWAVQDESAGGMALGKTGTSQGRVRVGDIVATRRAGSQESWTISCVRWVKSPNPSSVEIGIQRLAPLAKPVLIKVVSAEQEETEFLPALLLPAIPALKEPETLAIPANLFRPDRAFYLDDGATPRRIIASQLLEAASGYDRVAFRSDK